MRARFRGLAPDTFPPHEALYVSPEQIFLSPGKEYEVHAVSVYDGVAFLQVVDDLETPSFRPRVLFDVVDARVPVDWICNTFPSGPIQLVLGPPFVAKSLDSYEAMVDQRKGQVDEFWRRVDQAKQPVEDE